MAKKSSKKAAKSAPVVDTKKLQANDKPEITLAEVAAAKEIAKNESPVARGIRFNKLAALPSETPKQVKAKVVRVFGKSGYSSYSWDGRSKVLDVTTEELCRMFRETPDKVKAMWEAATAKKTTTDSK